MRVETHSLVTTSLLESFRNLIGENLLVEFLSKNLNLSKTRVIFNIL